MDLVQNLSPELLTAVLVLLVTWWAINRLLSNRNLPPGPWGWPVLGCYFSIKGSHEDYDRLRSLYGDVFSFRSLGDRLFVVLNGAKVIKEVLVNRADEFDGRPLEQNLLAWISNGLGIAQEEGDSWLEHRRFYAQSVRRFGVGKQEIEERIREECQQMIQDLRKQEKPGRPVHLPFHVSYVTNTIIFEILFGRRIEKQDAFGKFLKALHSFLTAFVGKYNMITGLAYDLGIMFVPKMRLLKEGRDMTKKIIDDIVLEKIDTYDPSHQRGYVDAYLNQRDELEKKGLLNQSTFTVDRLRAISLNMSFEGTESTGSAIVCLLLELAKHPGAQQRVQQELDEVVGRERLPCFEDRKRLPFVDATIQELFRMTAVFPFSTLYSNFKETTINGYRIPRRSIIFADYASIHFDPKEFPNPQKFDPNRFLDEDGKRIKKEGPYPFGVGKRSCIGEPLATVEVFLILTSMLQNFTLVPVEAKQDVKLIPRE